MVNISREMKNSTLVNVLKAFATNVPFNRGRTYSTHQKVLVLVLGVDPEPNLVVVL